jgi:ATP-binding cassette subfamily F protein 1
MPPKKSESSKKNDSTSKSGKNETKENGSSKSKNDKIIDIKNVRNDIKEVRGKNGKVKVIEEVLSVKQSKSQRKAVNAAIETARLDSRNRMENMSLVSDEEDNVFTSMKVLEDELGSNGVMRDSFGNTMSKNDLKNKNNDAALQIQRKEARARREAKEKLLELENSHSKTNNGKEKKVILSKQEEIELLIKKDNSGEHLSNKERKMLKAHAKFVAEESIMEEEFHSGLSSFSLTVSGRSTSHKKIKDKKKSNINIIDEQEISDEDEDTGPTLSATDVIVPCFTLTAPHRVLFSDANLRIVSGRRYGLLGPNGRGKSTLLKFMQTRKLPIPIGISMLMVEQEVMASTTSVVEQVLAADERRGFLLSEEERIMKIIDSGNDDDFNYGTNSGNLSNEDLEKAVVRLQSISSELDAIGAYSSEAKVRKILTGLGFSDQMQNGGSLILSGGWRVRISLARALFMEPKLLLLDEPTNHLDLDAVLWLDEYLSEQWKGSIVIVSHDSDFLDSVCTDIIHIDEAKLNYYSGSVTQFEKMKHQIESKKIKSWKLQQKTLKEFKDQGMTVEKSAKKTIDKLGITALMIDPPKEYRVKFEFKFAEDDMPTISVLDAGFRYGPDYPWLFTDLRFNIGTTSKIAIVGPNGAGKTTLLKMLTGKLEPTTGIVSLHRLLRIGIYNQHFEDLLPLQMTPIAYLTSEFPVSELEARKYLGMFGLDGARHLIKIGELSGGQKSRVVFASLALKKPHILILDEPTNHLDLESVEALIDALKVFPGGVVLVSHDARLISATECEIWVCEGGLQGSDGLYGTGLSVERRGFLQYRKDVLVKIHKKAEKAERDALIKAEQRREDRENRLEKAKSRYIKLYN